MNTMNVSLGYPMLVKDLFPITVLDPGTVLIDDTFVNVNNLIHWIKDTFHLFIRLTYTTGATVTIRFGTLDELEYNWDKLVNAIEQADCFNG